MPKATITQKDRINNDVVSYSLFSDFYDYMTGFIGKLEFLCEAGMGENAEMALYMVDDYVEEARKKADEFREKQRLQRGLKEIAHDGQPKSQPTETTEDTKRGVASSVETIVHSINRLKMLFNLSGTDLSSRGELEAFCDATGTILNADIEMLEDAVKGLNWFLETDGKGGAT